MFILAYKKYLLEARMFPRRGKQKLVKLYKKFWIKRRVCFLLLRAVFRKSLGKCINCYVLVRMHLPTATPPQSMKLEGESGRRMPDWFAIWFAATAWGPQSCEPHRRPGSLVQKLIVPMPTAEKHGQGGAKYGHNYFVLYCTFQLSKSFLFSLLFPRFC